MPPVGKREHPTIMAASSNLRETRQTAQGRKSLTKKYAAAPLIVMIPKSKSENPSAAKKQMEG
jgi:hypothetical protein